jgi:peptide/nickel transport system ATP-binding protein
MTTTPLLCCIDKLTVSYDAKVEAALKGINLSIQAKRRLAIIGESGSGKSTLAKALAKLLPRNAVVSGNIIWHPETVDETSRGFPVPGRDIGCVFQDPGASLNPVLTIGEQVAEAAVRHLGLSWKQAGAHARDLLGQVQLPHPSMLLKAFPHQLSGGQRQRVAIAAAISAQPKILIADEATSALDTVSQAAIARLLDRLVQDNGMTLIFITHDIGLAASLADDIAVLKDGQLMDRGEVGTVLSHASTAYIKELLTAHLDLTTPPLIERVQA